MSLSMIENQTSPLIRNRNVSHNRALKHVGPPQSRPHSKETPRTRVEDLIANRPVGRIELLVSHRYPRRTVMSKGWTGSIAAACGRDETGSIGLVLWGGQVDRVRTGDIISIQGGWCLYSHGQKVISTGRTGRLAILEA